MGLSTPSQRQPRSARSLGTAASPPPISKVMPRIARKCAACEKEDEDKPLQMKSVEAEKASGAAPMISQERPQLPQPRRTCDECEREERQRKLQKKFAGAA